MRISGGRKRCRSSQDRCATACSRSRNGQRITGDLCERLTEDDDVDAGDIEVQVQDGVAIFSGTVSDRWMKHRAEDIAEACAGVKDVDNRIRVSRGGGDRSGPATPAGPATPGP